MASKRRRKYPADVPIHGGHETITWTQFDRSGLTETFRSGWIWSAAPAIKGQRSFWVVPSDHLPGEPWAIVVSVISRRQQIGRAGDDRSRYRSGTGRVIDPGEVISEAHPDSPTGRITAAGHTPDAWRGVITMPVLPGHVYDVLSSTVR
jgi:hypothetical protein